MSDQVLGIINPIMALLFSIGAFLIWKRDTGKKYLIGMIIAPAALGLSFALNHYLPGSSGVSMRLFNGAIALIAVMSLVWAACQRLGQPAPISIWIAGSLGALGLVAFTDPVADITVWMFSLNSMCGVIFVMGAQSLYQAGSSDPIDRVTIWVFSLIAVQFFVRPAAVYIAYGPLSSDAYRESVGHALYIVVGALSMVMLAGVLMAAAMSDLMKAIKDSTQIDSLSGLVMRNAFEEAAAEMLQKARAEDVPVSLIVADIDHFKSVNDVWGHPAGDRAIANIGQVFKRTIRPSDLAGRIGGEEFCILVWDCPEEGAAGLAERLRIQFARVEHEGIGPDVHLTSSFGVAAWKPGEGYPSAYERADAALYRAKRAGRNRVVSNALGQIGEALGSELAEGSEEASDTGADIVSLSRVKNALLGN